MTDPPQAPPLANAVATLMNVSVDNAHMLQALTQHVIPNPHGRPDPVANNTSHDFLKTHPPVFHKAEEPLEVEDWTRTIEQKFSLIRCSDVSHPKISDFGLCKENIK